MKTCTHIVSSHYLRATYAHLYIRIVCHVFLGLMKPCTRYKYFLVLSNNNVFIPRINEMSLSLFICGCNCYNAVFI